MSEALAPAQGQVEAVILSGPRRGEIVHVDLDQHETWSDEELGRVVSAMQHLNAALENAADEARRLKDDVRRLREAV